MAESRWAGGWRQVAGAGAKWPEAGGWRGGWRQVAVGRWLGAGGWRQVAGGRWLEAGGWS